ncbi:hypothetical protein C5S31_02225 [ANME-1 cluster archaeon GoMg2]|nr:hypothetical protein [ANME-1 cluster archaeon GoMg2]
MRFTNRVRFGLLTGLIALNLILRYPVTPHEIGWDTFIIHILANSVSEFGWAKWWVHWLSIGGFYPYSYASSVPFLVSGISQCTGIINMEWTIWLFCTLTGIFTIYFAYILAGVIWNNDLFKFLVAFGYSVAPGLLTFSTWQLSSRGLFIVLLPLFIYMVLKTKYSLKYVPLAIILFMVLVVTHHLFYFTIPVIFSYIAVVIFYKLKERVKVKIPDFANLSFIGIFIVMLLIPFFTYMFISETGSRYTWLNLLAQTYMRFVGILLVFTIGGFVYLSLKSNKSFEEWCLLLSLICLAPLLSMVRYSKWVFIIFGVLIVSIGLINIAKAYNSKKGKYAFALIVIVLLLSVSFSGFYQHYRNIAGKATSNERYMEDATYIAALWIKDTIDKPMVGNDWVGRRVFAISEVPTLIGFGTIDLTYGFTKISDLNMMKISPFSTEFYFEGPYVRTPHTPYTSYYVSLLNEVEFDSYYGKPVISRFNLSCVIENEDTGDNRFIRSVHREKSNIYDNAKIRIWCLD